MTATLTPPATDARSLFQAAYENRYTWDNFPGYRADVTLSQGEETWQGQVAIAADFSVQVSGIDQPDVVKTLEAQLRDAVTHRQYRSFEAAHGANQFRLGETDASGAVEILVEGQAMGSAYKVRDQTICHVERSVGPMRFVIDTHATHDTGRGYLPVLTDAQFFNGASGALVKEVHYEDTYAPVGSLVLLQQQTLRVREGDAEIVTTIQFSNFHLGNLAPEGSP